MNIERILLDQTMGPTASHLSQWQSTGIYGTILFRPHSTGGIGRIGLGCESVYMVHFEFLKYHIFICLFVIVCQYSLGAGESNALFCLAVGALKSLLLNSE